VAAVAPHPSARSCRPRRIAPLADDLHTTVTRHTPSQHQLRRDTGPARLQRPDAASTSPTGGVAAGVADLVTVSDEREQGSRRPAAAGRRRLVFVPSSSDTGHELDASSLGIAEEALVAGIVPIQPPASVAPTAVRAGEGEVVKLRHLSSVTARPTRCRSSRKEASRDSGGPRPNRQRGVCRGACSQSVAKHQRSTLQGLAAASAR
jgi:hypothetical protein